MASLFFSPNRRSEKKEQKPLPPDFAALAPGAGCDIPLIEERGITLPQLGSLLCFFEENFCGEEARISREGDKLDVSTVNLYDIVEHVVKPATQQKRCSYVEFVASGPQKPKWFVSHWWGQKVAEFVRCLLQHSTDRALSDDVAYWVCAYAALQWSSEDDNMYACNQWHDPESSPFQKAMRLADGTISIIDSRAYYFRRVWCCYEIWSALTRASSQSSDDSASSSSQPDGYKYDIYTCVREDGAVGITDGLAQVDLRCGKHWWTTNKYHREKSFPVELARNALRLKLERGEASKDEDRKHILNSIAGAEDLDATPVEKHACYDRLNHTVGGRFAAAAWRVALEADFRMEEFAQALSLSSLTKLSISFDSCKLQDPATSLGAGLAPSMRELDLDFNGCTGFSDEDLTSLTSALPCSLQKLKLDLAGCRFSIDGMRRLAQSLQKQAQQEDLSLSFAGCSNLAETDVLEVVRVLPKKLKRLQLNFYGIVQVGDACLKALEAALPSTLLYLELRVARCPDVSDAGVQVLAGSLPPGLQHLVLDFRFCVNLSDQSPTALAKHLPSRLKHLEIDFVSCTNVSSEAEEILKAALSPLGEVEFIFWGKDDFAINM